MKEFNLELAKAGHPVCTRDGKPARIISFDANMENFPIVAVVTFDGHEELELYTEKGKFFKTEQEDEFDLMMISEVKDGDDKRIKEAISYAIANSTHEDGILLNGVTESEAIAWLEKQGEQTSADKAEPKFKVGDWITDGVSKCQIRFIDDTQYWYSENCILGSVESVDKRYHLWTIQDAKDGDILVDGVPFIFKKIDSLQHTYAYCGIDGFLDFRIESAVESGEWTWMQDIKPATKEQRDLLFKKMKEAGYEWDAEKKELTKIEQKSVEKVEPKFKVGDWVVHNKNIELANSLMLVTGKDNNEYLCKNIEGQCSYNIEFIDKDYHLWTIEDAKDGDVLVASDGSIFLLKGVVDGACKHYVALTSDNVVKFNEGLEHNWETSIAVHPATKEQRDTLEKAMADAGYTFNFEKRKLKKIEQTTMVETCEIENIEHGKYYYCIKDYFCGGRKQASKGDVVQALRGMSMMALGVKANEYFLPVNSIKENPIWSKEDEKKRKGLIKGLEDRMGFGWASDPFSREEYIDWLKSLKNRVQKQPKKEWSAEDKGNLLDVKCIIDEVWQNQHVREEIDHSCEELESLWHWLDNIWQRVEYPQNTWKPSDGQMKALYNLMKYAVSLSAWGELENKIESLYKDLKKLREE